jgi:hypothetical protein
MAKESRKARVHLLSLAIFVDDNKLRQCKRIFIKPFSAYFTLGRSKRVRLSQTRVKPSSLSLPSANYVAKSFITLAPHLGTKK